MATIVDQRGRRLALARSGELAIIDSEGRERASHKLPYCAQILHKDGEKVKKGDRIAEWDPFTMPLITEKQGIVKYQDLAEGKTLVEQVDEEKGIAQRVVIEYRSASPAKQEHLQTTLPLIDDPSGTPARSRRPVRPPPLAGG